MIDGVVLDLVRHVETFQAVLSYVPSLQDARPWRLRVTSAAVELHADPARRLADADPDQRQLHLGLGAALYALRLAVADLRRDTRLELLPDPARPTLVARLEVVGRRDPTEVEHALLHQVHLRQTVGAPFGAGQEPVTRAVQAVLAGHAAAEGVLLRWVNRADEGRPVAAVLAEAGPSWLVGPAGLTGVLVTADDRAADWLTGGQALMRVLLAASAEGLASVQLPRPIERPELRDRLTGILRLARWPQLVLQFGYPAAAPRR
jgi:hypothetical protein